MAIKVEVYLLDKYNKKYDRQIKDCERFSISKEKIDKLKVKKSKLKVKNYKNEKIVKVKKSKLKVKNYKNEKIVKVIKVYVGSKNFLKFHTESDLNLVYKNVDEELIISKI